MHLYFIQSGFNWFETAFHNQLWNTKGSTFHTSYPQFMLHLRLFLVLLVSCLLKQSEAIVYTTVYKYVDKYTKTITSPGPTVITYTTKYIKTSTSTHSNVKTITSSPYPRTVTSTKMHTTTSQVKATKTSTSTHTTSSITKVYQA